MLQKKKKPKDCAPAIGIKQSTYSRKINGKLEWNIKQITKFAEFLECDVKDFCDEPLEKLQELSPQQDQNLSNMLLQFFGELKVIKHIVTTQYTESIKSVEKNLEEKHQETITRLDKLEKLLSPEPWNGRNRRKTEDKTSGVTNEVEKKTSYITKRNRYGNIFPRSKFG